ncbi:ComF family protein [Luethyella okanaganae]|uniref:ComF family protein n=1 Tax=Luethyella okanaganae TaxID=69372 RepID=A0ABW1VBM8_9MICO
MGGLDGLARAATEAFCVVVPIVCASCGRPDGSLCAACLAELEPRPHLTARLGIPIWCVYDYDGAVRRAIIAFKDAGRTDLARVLGRGLRAAVSAALGGGFPLGLASGASAVELVTIPSSRTSWRARGYHPVGVLLRRAGLRPSALLRHSIARADQVGLGREARRVNLEGTLVVRSGIRRSRRASIAGRAFLIVDDIVTTGATIQEAARAIEAAGGSVLGAAVLAETRLRSDRNFGARETRRNNR